MDARDERTLGRTSLSLTVLGFGGSVVGNLHRPVAAEAAAGAVKAAFDAGIRYFDTAPLYGRGLGEHRLGRALRHRRRESFVLSSKVGCLLAPSRTAGRGPNALPFDVVYDYSYDGTMRSLEDSLQRLGMDRIDLALIHDIDPHTHGQNGWKHRFREAMKGAYPALVRLKREGTVTAIGVGVNDWRVCQACAEAGEFDCFLLAGRYTLLEQEPLRTFLPLCERRGIGVIAGAPYNSGILARGAVDGARYNYRAPRAPILERVRGMERVCAAHRVALAAAALRFPLGHGSVASVLPGTRSAAHVKRNVAAFRARIPADFWLELKHEGLIDAEAPVPPPR